ncbi:O-fucosyltransferase family protein [Rhodotorula paludigena]|uniref:O-fucosyltransferase family protein n=1 Tax=Rhodotorula paludigena TaxID=86838 RepID=UPI00317F8AE3
MPGLPPPSPSPANSPALDDPLLPAHLRSPYTPDLANAGRFPSRADHAAYDLSPDPNDFRTPSSPSSSSAGSDFDEKDEIARAVALLNGSASSSRSASSSAGSAGWPTPSAGGASKAPLSAWLAGLARRVTRRTLLAALLAAVFLASIGSAVRSAQDAEGEAVGAGGWKGAVYTRWNALRYSRIAWEHEPVHKPLNLSKILNYDEPRATLREQLKPGLRYVTAMAYGGHANQLISIQKMLYFAKMTNRVGIIPSLIPVHIDGAPTDITEFYDLARFWTESHIPAVEMSRVKPIDLKSEGPQNERLSCWSVQEATVGFANLEAWSFDLHDIWIDHWALPRSMARGIGGFDLAFDALRLFDFDVWGKIKWVEEIQRKSIPQQLLPDGSKNKTAVPKDNLKRGFDPVNSAPPDDQIACFDNTLFLGPVMFEELPITDEALELPVPGEGLSWINAGQYLHFNDAVEQRADEYLMALFGVSRPSAVPPFITIHLRRGDFKEFTGFTALEKYVAALERVRERLQARLDDPHGWTGPGRAAFRKFGRLAAKDYAVVATTDERGDSEFVQEVRALGWKVLDHEAFETKDKLGGWWPTMLDGAILARGRAFVGTDRSTFSHLAGVRVKYWRGGLVETAI